MQKELEQLPETLKELDPVQRLNILCKLMPYVLPKTESVKHNFGEPDEFKIKQSERMKGKNNPMFGKTHSEETKNKQSERMRGENNPSCKLRKKYEVNGIIIDNAVLFCKEHELAYTNFIKYADTDKKYKGYIIKRIMK
jgi:hypothetical protein